MGIIQGHFAYALQTGQSAALFVTMHHTQFGDADRQFAVAVDVIFIDHHMMRTVHRTQHQHFAITHVHRWEHVIVVVIPVAGSFVQFHIR